MSIVFGAFCPHPPIAIPNIGQSNLSRLKNTVESYRRLASSLLAADVESLIVISPHGENKIDSWTINLSPRLTGTLEMFGDLETKISADNDLELAYIIQQACAKKISCQAVAQENIDYGLTIPLWLIGGRQLPPLVPLTPANLPADQNFNLGRFLSATIQFSGKRVGILASGDLSHCLSKEAPGGWNPKGKKFDQKIIDSLRKKDYAAIIKLDERLADEAQECGWKSLAILLGAMDNLNAQPLILSYEFPFGVGYLCVNFDFGQV